MSSYDEKGWSFTEHYEASGVSLSEKEVNRMYSILGSCFHRLTRDIPEHAVFSDFRSGRVGIYPVPDAEGVFVSNILIVKLGESLIKDRIGPEIEKVQVIRIPLEVFHTNDEDNWDEWLEQKTGHSIEWKVLPDIETQLPTYLEVRDAS